MHSRIIVMTYLYKYGIRMESRNNLLIASKLSAFWVPLFTNINIYDRNVWLNKTNIVIRKYISEIYLYKFPIYWLFIDRFIEFIYINFRYKYIVVHKNWKFWFLCLHITEVFETVVCVICCSFMIFKNKLPFRINMHIWVQFTLLPLTSILVF